jgi:hypothetical protein
MKGTKGAIGGLHWTACETCSHGARKTGGCDVEESMTYHLDYTNETLVCDSYEKKYGLLLQVLW